MLVIGDIYVSSRVANGYLLQRTSHRLIFFFLVKMFSGLTLQSCGLIIFYCTYDIQRVRKKFLQLTRFSHIYISTNNLQFKILSYSVLKQWISLTQFIHIFFLFSWNKQDQRLMKTSPDLYTEFLIPTEYVLSFLVQIIRVGIEMRNICVISLSKNN